MDNDDKRTLLFKLAPYVPYTLTISAEVPEDEESCIYMDLTMSIESISNLASTFKEECEDKKWEGGLPYKINDVYDEEG